jgi:hypothetical protein
VNCLVVDESSPATLYVATDVGPFYTADLGGTWHALGTGLPEDVVVTDLELLPGAAPTLYAATYGRSMWSLDVSGLGLLTAATDPGAGPSPEPAGIRLSPSAPNPMTSRAVIRFELARAGRARLDVINALGQRVRTLADGEYAEGAHTVAWDGADARGRAVASGTYFYRLESGGRVVTGRLTVTR